MKYVHLDDQAIKIGGTNLTSLALFEDRLDDIAVISCPDLTIELIERYSDRPWVMGNIIGLAGLSKQIIDRLFEVNFVKIEFDYNYCPYRGEVPHKMNGNEACNCPHGNGHPTLSRIYQFIPERAKWIFYMSERQRCIHVFHMPNIKLEKTSILSSCFSRAQLDLFEQKRSQRLHNGKWAVLNGFGGWHSQAKGLQEAIGYCTANSLKYDVLSIAEYEVHIDRLSNYKGLVFLPIVDDTCPRCIIEARLMGLEVVTNANSQHVTEQWWRDGDVKEYIAGRPAHLWRIIDDLCSNSLS